ncbi:MAG: hypothetical protein ABIO70_31245 [Pseudomonadota bacterium]
MARLARIAVLLTCGLLACGDPVAGEIASYHAAMDPLMTENTRLASQFLSLAKSVRQDQKNLDGVVQLLEAKVVPAAESLKAGAEEVHPGLEELQDIHAQAITAWTIQAKAYEDMVAAWKANDPAAFADAQGRLAQAKVTIESYVREVNRLLEPYGYHLDEFPPLR